MASIAGIGERIRDFFLYGDTDRESYRAISDKIEAGNRISSLVFSSVATVLIAAMLLISFRLPSFVSSRPVYAAGVALSLLILAVSLASWRWPLLTYVSVYMAISVFLGYGIALATLTRPEEQTVTFMVMMIFVPLIFVDRPIRMAAALVAFIAAFVVLAYQTKAPDVLAADVTDAYIFGFLSIVAQSVVNRAKIRGYVLERRLHIMGQTDQLTRLNNRNCYELRLGEYPGRIRQSICCVYLDADGLHELNNAKGHQEGDRMLCLIAQAMRDAFGPEESYRVGGDEFVSFVMDRPQDETERAVAHLREAVEAAGYHVSVGLEWAEAGGLAFEELVSRAEAKMYEAKAAYYRQHDRRHR